VEKRSLNGCDVVRFVRRILVQNSRNTVTFCGWEHSSCGLRVSVAGQMSDSSFMCAIPERKKDKGRTLNIAPQGAHCHHRGAQGRAHQAASHIPALYLPDRSRYSFTDPERMEG